MNAVIMYVYITCLIALLVGFVFGMLKIRRRDVSVADLAPKHAAGSCTESDTNDSGTDIRTWKLPSANDCRTHLKDFTIADIADEIVSMYAKEITLAVAKGKTEACVLGHKIEKACGHANFHEPVMDLVCQKLEDAGYTITKTPGKLWYGNGTGLVQPVSVTVSW